MGPHASRQSFEPSCAEPAMTVKVAVIYYSTWGEGSQAPTPHSALHQSRERVVHAESSVLRPNMAVGFHSAGFKREQHCCRARLQAGAGRGGGRKGGGRCRGHPHAGGRCSRPIRFDCSLGLRQGSIAGERARLQNCRGHTRCCRK
jgi:hypothetical protein